MIDKKDDKKSKEYSSMTKHGPAWHGGNPMKDVMGEAISKAKEMLKKMKGKGKDKKGTTIIEIEVDKKKDK